MPAKWHRITRGEDYRRIVRKGSRVGASTCIAHAVLHVHNTPDGPARFGFIVSKAVGNAVTRNLVRRRMKAIAQDQLKSGFTGADVVFRALPTAATAEFTQLERDMVRSLDRVTRMAREVARGVESTRALS